MPWKHRDDGGGLDTTSGSGVGLGGVAPSAQAQNPIVQGRMQQFANLPTEKLAEMGARLGGSAQGQLIQHILTQRRLVPSATAPTPTPTYQRGGGMKKRADGGDAGPWWGGSDTSGDSGFLHGSTPGRADSVKTTAPGGSYVFPADVIAGLGEGNSLAGARVMQMILDSGPHGIPQARASRGMGPPRPPPAYREEAARGGEVRVFPHRAAGGATGGDKRTPVALSDGEFVASPHHSQLWGGGDISRGHRLFDKWVLSLRKAEIEKAKKRPPPVGSKK